MISKVCQLVLTASFILNHFADSFEVDRDFSDLIYSTNNNYELGNIRRYVRQDNQKCQIPDFPRNTKYKIVSDTTTQYKPGDYVGNYNVLEISCNQGYKLNPLTRNHSTCLNGKWDIPLTNCLRACPSLKSVTSTNVTCTWNDLDDNDIPLNNCIDPVEGTTAKFSCNPLFEEASIEKNPVRICRNGRWNPSIPQCSPICGIKTPKGIPNIINGTNATPGDYPWQVGIYDMLQQFICAGSILDNRIVISAAHCFTDYSGNILPFENYFVAAGKYYRQYDDNRDDFAQYSTIHKIFVPRRYKGVTNFQGFDIAIVILAVPFKITLQVQPICIELNEESQALHLSINRNGLVTGWGYTQSGRELSEQLKEVVIPYIPYDECFDASPNNFRKYITHDKICGGYINNGTSVCGGDSGGGLIFKKLNSDQYYIKGIVSVSPTTNEGKCNSEMYSVFTSINEHIGFVRKFVTFYQTLEYLECIEDDCLSEITENSVMCQLPRESENGIYSVINRNDTYKPGGYVLPNSILFIICKPEFELTSHNHLNLFNCSHEGVWTPKLEGCTKKAVNTTECRTPENDEGNCMSLHECSNLLHYLQLRINGDTFNVLKSYQCHKNSLKVCCPNKPIINNNYKPDSDTLDIHTEEPILYSTTTETLDTKHRNLVLLPNDTDCGPFHTKNRIINGKTTALFDFPWMALLLYRTRTGVDFKCEGTLISTRYVLTAAHCITQFSNFTLHGVRLGEYNISSPQDCEMESKNTVVCADPVQDILIEEVIPHPNYNSRTFINDIGLIRLSSPAIFTESVQPICLPTRPELQNKDFGNIKLFETGWGSTEAERIRSDVLLKVDTFLVSEAVCKLMYNQTNDVVQKQLCAIGKNRKVLCGDSGGPLQVIEDFGIDLQYVQIGILSFNSKYCELDGLPNVYTKIDSYIDWILDTIHI